MNILELHLLTRDLTQTEYFYTSVLGLQSVSKNGASISFTIGHSILFFTETNKTNPYYHFAFTIPANKIDEALQWLAPKVDIIPVTETEKIADFISWNAKAVYFYDPSGNIVEFIARFDLKNSTENPFDSSAILSISEIGLPVDDLVYRTETLVTAHYLSYFSKQPSRSDFTVIGDDNGLLIFVPPGRNWYPTTTPSEKHWVRVKTENNHHIREFTFNG